jgi:hypothetical protein
MLRILIDNEIVDISGINFTLMMKSPIFYPEEGSYSLPLTFPFTPRNSLIFGYPNRIELYADILRDHSIYISFAGITLINDTIQVTKANNKIIEGFIKVGEGFFNSLIKSVKLKDIDYGDDITLGSTPEAVLAHALAVIAQSYPDVNYQFPSIYNPKFYGEENEKNPDFLSILNYYLAGAGRNYFLSNAIYEDPSKDNQQSLLPLPYLFYVLKKIFEFFNYSLSGDFLQDDELKELLIYNNRALDRKEKKYYARASLTATQNVHIADYVIFDDDSTDDNEDDDSLFNTTLGAYEIASKGYHNVTVNIKVGNGSEGANVYGLIRIMNSGDVNSISLPENILTQHKYTFWVDEADVGKEIKYYVYDDDMEADFDVLEAEIIITHVSESNLNRFATSMNIQDHVPDVEISTLLTAIKKTFGTALLINNTTNEARLLFLKNIINAASYIEFSDNIIPDPDVEVQESEGNTFDFNWSDKNDFFDDNFKGYEKYTYLGAYDILDDLPVQPLLNQIALVKNLNAIYIYSSDEDNNIAWRKLTDNFLPLIIDDGGEDMAPDMSPLTMERVTEVVAIMPAISQMGSSSAFDTGDNECDLHLLFYRGLQDDENGDHFPLAAPTRYDSLGNVVGSYELIWDGANGLYKTFWEDFIEWYKSVRVVYYYKQMSAAEFQQFDFSKKYRIFGIDYLVKDIEVSITENEIKPAKLTMLKV